MTDRKPTLHLLRPNAQKTRCGAQADKTTALVSKTTCPACLRQLYFEHLDWCEAHHTRVTP